MISGTSLLPSMKDIEPNWTTGQSSGDDHEKPGYRLEPFIDTFISTRLGPVPVLSTAWSRTDWASTISVRTGFGRDSYRISPGLYAVGAPTDQSDVLVTANFKLTTTI